MVNAVYSSMARGGDGYDPEEAIPDSLNLSSTMPFAIKSYIKRFMAIQSPNTYANLPGQEITIPIDTSTPGAFLDTKNSYLKFDITVTNTNLFADYFDLGPGGLGAIIEKIVIKSQNSQFEEIQDYNTVWQQMCEIQGCNQEEFFMFQSRLSNCHAGGFSSSSKGNINFCKLPMVDLSGKIMHAITSYNQNSIHGWTVQNATGAEYTGNNGMNALAAYNLPTTAGSLAVTRPINFERGGHQNDALMFARGEDSMNPRLWPDYIGVEPLVPSDHISKKKGNRLQDYSTYLANVKNIPIGMRSNAVRDTNRKTYGLPFLTGSTYVENSDLVPGVFTYTCCMPFMSGVFGLQQQKMFPTMICRDISINIWLAQPGKVFKLSMDPCRRLVGSRRDYVVYYGNQLGSIDTVAASIGAVNQYDANPYPLNFANAMVGNTPSIPATAASGASEYLPAFGFTSVAAQTAGAQATYPLVFPVTYPLATNPQAGWPAFPFYNYEREFITDTVYALPSRPGPLSYFGAGLIPQYFIPSLIQVPVTGQGERCLGLAYVNSGDPGDMALADNINTDAIPNNVWRSRVNVGNDGMGCYGTFLDSSVAQTKRVMYNFKKINDPQYLVDFNNGNIKYPRVFAGHGGADATKTVTYTVTNIMYVCQQIILPASITSGIIEMATRGAIMFDSDTIKMYPQLQVTPGSTSQNILIPAKIGLANTLGVIFRVSEQLNSGPKQFMYDSLCGYNPLVAKIMHHDGTSYSGTNIPPTVIDLPCSNSMMSQTSTGFSYQLMIGGDCVPQQPITSAMEIMAENEKATHGLFDLDNNMTMVGNVHTGVGKRVGDTGLRLVGDNVPDATVHDTSQHGSFWCTWHDPDFLADQTLINNSLMRHLTSRAGMGYNTGSTNATIAGQGGGDSYARLWSARNWVPVPIGRYYWPMFKTPDSRFKLLFELDSFSKVSHVSQSGRNLSTSTVSLKCEGFNLFSQLVNNDTPISVICSVFVTCAFHIQIEAGGVVRGFV